ncbi:TraR/DksA family transcriptional regulator [Catellatospora methionotrophica]|nr:TraR/DksA family transcriptional regulator [Catellatospora methionotrophica]
MSAEGETMTAVAGSADLADIARLLRQRHDDTAERLRSLREQTVTVLAGETGSGDAADAGTLVVESAEQAMLTAALSEQLEKLQTALSRLEAGTFGVCARCGQQVPVIRLEVMPWATHCVPCQSALEKRR